MQSDLYYCHYARREPFPISADSFALGGGLVPQGETFGLYLPHLMKASAILHQPANWITPDIREVARCLKTSMIRRFDS